MAGLGLFIGGVLCGSVGLKALKSKEAKKTYSKIISYGLDAKDYVMETADNVKEGWDDVYADAKDLKQARDEEKAAEAEQIIEDASEDTKPAKTTKKTTAKKTATKTTAKKSAAKASAEKEQ